MNTTGVHLAITASEAEHLRELDDVERLDYVSAALKNEYLEGASDLATETDRAWDAMHRVLSDGRLTFFGGEFPLNYVVLGGEVLCTSKKHILSLKSPEQVRRVAMALDAITRQEFRRRYDAIDPHDYRGIKCDRDFQETWELFQHVRDLFIRAATRRRYVLFTANHC